MPSRKLQQSLYGVRGACAAQRVTLAVLVGCSVALAWWLLFGGGIAAAGAWFGHTMCMASPVRRASMAIALFIYFIRLLFTEFVFLRRGVSWNEAFTIAPWVLFIFVFLSFAAGANAAAPGLAACAGAALFLCGSWMNSYAEYKRHAWKQRPENRGRLYTLSLFRFSRHPNYLGDLISSSGLCLLSGSWMTAVIPVVMLLGFIFVNVPVLDAHLHDHYCAEFDEYARRTRKLIPFLY